MNYGYSLIRSAIARELSAHGFQPALGVHHCNEQNPFNLADDLIEPYRSVVDFWVYENMAEIVHFEKKQRRALMDILALAVKLNGRRETVHRSIELMCNSLLGAFRAQKTDVIQLPELIELVVLDYE